MMAGTCKHHLHISYAPILLHIRIFPPTGDVAEGLGKGLQNPLQRFESARRLHTLLT